MKTRILRNNSYYEFVLESLEQGKSLSIYQYPKGEHKRLHSQHLQIWIEDVSAFLLEVKKIEKDVVCR